MTMPMYEPSPPYAGSSHPFCLRYLVRVRVRGEVRVRARAKAKARVRVRVRVRGEVRAKARARALPFQGDDSQLEHEQERV